MVLWNSLGASLPDHRIGNSTLALPERLRRLVAPDSHSTPPKEGGR